MVISSQRLAVSKERFVAGESYVITTRRKCEAYKEGE